MEMFFWLVLIVVFLVIETQTVTITSLWFSVGALGALIASLLGAEHYIQICIFFGVSVALLAALRPWVKKFVTPKITKTNVDSVIGSQGYVTAEIDNLSAKGQVKLGAMEWTARSSSGEKIPEGTLVQVDKIEGVKVFVTVVK